MTMSWNHNDYDFVRFILYEMESSCLVLVRSIMYVGIKINESGPIYQSEHIRESRKMTGRNPEPTNAVTSKVMKANKGKDTGPEQEVRRILREIGYPGYRLNWKKVPGRPDIAYPGRKIAIFVNGCFWHRCPRCNLPLPKTHTEFWQQKFERNVTRDQEKTRALEALGWTVITIWECELKDSDAVKGRLSALFP